MSLVKRGSLLFACSLLVGLACVPRGGARHPTPGAPNGPEPEWIDAPLVSGPAGAAAGVDEASKRLGALARRGAKGEAGARLARLDRLVDLLDAARFAKDARARGILWEALGGTETSTGYEAYRAAALALLQEAWAIEDAFPDLGGSSREWLDGVISLLSNDLNLPHDAEALAIQTAAYRGQAREGHPRVADNAHWRLYDHVRAVLEAAVEEPAGRRSEVAAHVLYAETEDIVAHLDDRAPHTRPPLPAPDELWAVLERHRAALRDIPRWTPIVESRREDDAKLQATVEDALPRPRPRDWKLVEVPVGTARPESRGPALELSPGKATLDPGGSRQKVLSVVNPELARGIETLLAQDGRGVLMVAIDPVLPSPELRAALNQIVAGRVGTMELAVHEQRLGEHAEAGSVVVALPLQLSVPGDAAIGSRAFREARVHVALYGRGPRVRVDGLWTDDRPQTAEELQTVLTRVHRAFPRERVVSVSLAGDVLGRQLIDLLTTLVGGDEPLFAAAGWRVEEIGAPGKADPGAKTKLDARSALVGRTPRMEQPFPLEPSDQGRIEQSSLRLARCLPELESSLPSKGVGFSLRFEEGVLVELDVTGLRKKDNTRKKALEACAREELGLLRLRKHRDRIELAIAFDR